MQLKYQLYSLERPGRDTETNHVFVFLNVTTLIMTKLFT
jgi:hypothetical protein